MHLERILSGGQTGADRAAWDAAMELGIPQDGWVPRGRTAEDGPVSFHYTCRETETEDYVERTERNVEEADATVVFTDGRVTGGTAYTIETASRFGKPVYRVDFAQRDLGTHQAGFRNWLIDHEVQVLNVGGSRESLCPGLYSKVRAFLLATLPEFIAPEDPGEHHSTART